jgi:acetoin utilization deacetylase AcuC-like enzyme
VDAVAATEGQTFRFDPDTQAGPDSYAAALKAAGAVTDAVERVRSGELQRALCLVRPPGHHAEADRAMGFCLFNNVAGAAAAALAQGLERVAILDIDVHHGNGTQHLFEQEPRVLYVSSHAWPFYPGTGAVDEVGEGPGEGFTVNLPLPSGSDDAVYARVYRELVEPVVRSFAPELVIVSAGFDTWGGDPLAGMQVSAAGYAELADVCLAVAEPAAQGRVVFALEGGYSLDGLEAGTAALADAALGRVHERLEIPADTAARLMPVYREVLAPRWPVLGPG